MKPSKSSISMLIAVLSFGTIFVASVFTTRSTVVARVRVGEPVGSIKPIKGVDVIVQKKPGNTAVRSLQTDAEGSFTVDTLPPGSYQLWLKCKECQSIAIDEPGVQRTVVATVIPQGKEFRVQFDEAQVTIAHEIVSPRDAASGLPTGKRRAPLPSTWASREQFKESLQRDGLSRLKTLFPNGIPQEATGKVKITIWVKPPAWGVSIEW